MVAVPYLADSRSVHKIRFTIFRQTDYSLQAEVKRGNDRPIKAFDGEACILQNRIRGRISSLRKRNGAWIQKTVMRSLFRTEYMGMTIAAALSTILVMAAAGSVAQLVIRHKSRIMIPII